MRKLTIIGFSILFIVSAIVFWFVNRNRPVSLEELSPISASDDQQIKPGKLILQEEGFYEVDLADLGLEGALPEDFDKSNLVLSNQGQPVTFWVTKDGRRIRFFGQAIDHPYTLENVYWISEREYLDGNPHRTALQDTPDPSSWDESYPSGLMDLPEGSYTAINRQEVNELYNPLVNEDDHWFWLNLPAPMEKELVFSASAVQPAPARIRIRVWGTTDTPESIDHHLLVKLNDQTVVDERWDGKGMHLVEADITANVLLEGSNRLTIQVPGDTDAVADIIMLDWFEIIYPRRFQAEQDRLKFVSPGGTIQSMGFSGLVDVYDVTLPDQVGLVAEQIDPNTGFDSEEGHTYWMVGPRGYESVNRIEPIVETPDLRKIDTAADYLAVGPAELLKAIDPLQEWHKQHGLDSQAIPIQAIYDQFNYGIPHPEAIRRFLSYATSSWEKPPKYLLLVGDASYDPKGYGAPSEANQVPTFFVQTQYGGQTASDLGYSYPGTDPWESQWVELPGTGAVAVGRLPARTPGQVENYVNKVLAYEQLTGSSAIDSEWTGRVLAVVDGQDPVFRLEAENLLKVLSKSYITRVVSPEINTAEANKEVVSEMNEGNKFVIYIGHGSINMWGKDQIFSIKDMNSLQNEARLPIVLNFTCLNGLFTHPIQDSLAEAFLWEPGGGAVAVLAPTSLTLPEDQSYLSTALGEAILEMPGGRLGDILNKARLAAANKMTGSPDVINTFLLFGDPALVLVNQNP